MWVMNTSIVFLTIKIFSSYYEYIFKSSWHIAFQLPWSKTACIRSMVSVFHPIRPIPTHTCLVPSDRENLHSTSILKCFKKKKRIICKTIQNMSSIHPFRNAVECQAKFDLTGLASRASCVIWHQPFRARFDKNECTYSNVSKSVHILELAGYIHHHIILQFKKKLCDYFALL